MPSKTLKELLPKLRGGSRCKWYKARTAVKMKRYHLGYSQQKGWCPVMADSLQRSASTGFSCYRICLSCRVAFPKGTPIQVSGLALSGSA